MLLPSGARKDYFRGSAIYAEMQSLGSQVHRSQSGIHSHGGVHREKMPGAGSPGRIGPAAPWRCSHLGKKSTSEPGQLWEDYSNSLIFVLVLLPCKTEMETVATGWSCCED